MFYSCPKCDGRELRVVVQAWATLMQEPEDDNFQTDVEETDHEWSSDSAMECVGCGHRGRVLQFSQQEEKDNN